MIRSLGHRRLIIPLQLSLRGLAFIALLYQAYKATETAMCGTTHVIRTFHAWKGSRLYRQHRWEGGAIRWFYRTMKVPSRRRHISVIFVRNDLYRRFIIGIMTVARLFVWEARKWNGKVRLFVGFMTNTPRRSFVILRQPIAKCGWVLRRTVNSLMNGLVRITRLSPGTGTYACTLWRREVGADTMIIINSHLRGGLAVLQSWLLNYR